MERSGMRWTEQMAEAIVQLRAIYLSGDFDGSGNSTSIRISAAYTQLSGPSFQSSHTHLNSPTDRNKELPAVALRRYTRVC